LIYTPALWAIIPLILLGLPAITEYLENRGTLEVAQRTAGHADRRTTKLYDRLGQKVLLEDRNKFCNIVAG
jgi:hypothetical protein